jgi:hypothetical protein
LDHYEQVKPIWIKDFYHARRFLPGSWHMQPSFLKGYLNSTTKLCRATSRDKRHTDRIVSNFVARQDFIVRVNRPLASVIDARWDHYLHCTLSPSTIQ